MTGTFTPVFVLWHVAHEEKFLRNAKTRRPPYLPIYNPTGNSSFFTLLALPGRAERRHVRIREWIRGRRMTRWVIFVTDGRGVKKLSALEQQTLMPMITSGARWYLAHVGRGGKKNKNLKNAMTQLYFCKNTFSIVTQDRLLKEEIHGIRCKRCTALVFL